MKKGMITLLLAITFMVTANAQYLWYENETNTINTRFLDSDSGYFTTNITNPVTTGLNNNVVASKFIRDEGKNAYANFEIYEPIVTATTYTISLKAYLDIPTSEFASGNNRIRIYLKNTGGGTSIYKQLTFNNGQQWQEFTFVFNSTDFSAAVLADGGYNQMRIAFAAVATSLPSMNYYVDSIYGTTDQEKPPRTIVDVDWLKGSWGITYPVHGGIRFDEEVADDGYDHIAGAQEIVDELPAVGHIMVNLSYFAHSHYFTIKDNSYVDVANEIHPDIVPSAANEQIMFDVLDIFKNSGKKMIFYISSNYFEDAEADNPAIKVAWEAYYNSEFSGDEYAAYENLCKGFIEKVKDYADGYWLDTTTALVHDSKLDDFIRMIRLTDPGAMVTANSDKNYFTDESGDELLVDTDGITDSNDADYKIVLHEPLNSHQDITNGHITPLSSGAPPNSWGYDEFTIPNIVAQPTIDYDGYSVLKHAWFPVREKWHVPTFDLLCETEQAYRFVKSITDTNASITFATTTDYGKWNAGYIMQDEMDIMKEINDRLLSATVPDFEPYVRPEGAFLVGEEHLYPWYENETITDNDYITYTQVNDALFAENKTNYYYNDVNSTPTVAKFKRDGGSTPLIYFDLSNTITDLSSSFIVSLEAYMYVADSTLNNDNNKIRIYLRNSTSRETIYEQLRFSTGKAWESFEFDFTGRTVPIDGYDQMMIGFANGDTSGLTTRYYLDNVKGSLNQNTTGASAKSLSISKEVSNLKNTNSIGIYPNPVTNSFRVSKNIISATIYTITGKKLIAFSGKENIFDVSKLSKGLYVLNVIDSDGKTELIRFVKK